MYINRKGTLQGVYQIDITWFEERKKFKIRKVTKRKLTFMENCFNGKISYSEFNLMRVNSLDIYYKVDEEFKKKHPEYEMLNKKSQELYNKSETAKRIFANSYSGFSDMMEASQNKTINGYGHGLSYWNHSSMRGTEAFAEIYAALTVEDKRPLELMTKYCPKSVEIVKELLSKKVDY